MSILYTPDLSGGHCQKKIRWIARKYKNGTAFKTQNTLRQSLTKQNQKLRNNDPKTFYDTALECNDKYSAKKRPLEIRLKEHKHNVKTGDTKHSKSAEHSRKHEYRFNWDNSKILHKESNVLI